MAKDDSDHELRRLDQRLPGDPGAAQRVAAMIRVDQAGEYGAARIYAGQMAVLGRSPVAPVIRAMADQERQHLETFDRLIAERGVRPTLLSPLWHVGGFVVGAASAVLGERAAMACTEAVETVIDEHYAAQVEELGDAEPELKAVIAEFRDHEIAHRDTARAHDAELAPGYVPLGAAIRAGTRLAIWLSTRI